MKIGLIMPEFSPAFGGMEEYARELSRELSRTDEVVVYSREAVEMPGESIVQAPILTGDLAVDGRRLAVETPDVWLTTNAGVTALAPRLSRPLAVLFNGNDFLNPSIGLPHPWVERFVTTRGMWRIAPALRRRLRRSDIRRGIRRAARIFAISENTARLIEATYPGHTARTRIIPPGVAQSFFQPRAERGPQDRTLNLLTVARLHTWAKRKNIDSVLQALTLLPSDLPVRYTIVGDGDDRERLIRLCQSLGISDKVRFTGAVDREEVLRCYAEADLFVLAVSASPLDVEGFGMVYVEAAAAGVPSLCSRAGGATDAVVDGVTGILLDGSSPEEIASGIQRFAARRADFSSLTIRGFAEQFQWMHIAARVREELAAMAESGPDQSNRAA